MYKYILFDLDGTLTDPGIGITGGVMNALKKFHIEIPPRTELYKFIGPPLKDSFMQYYGMSESDAVLAIDYYREYYAVTGIYENEVYPGIPALLSKLKELGLTLSLATSKPEYFSKLILEHFELDKYFDFIAGATMDEKRVNKDEVIEYALSTLHIKEKSEVLMIGDRLHDINGAHACGIDSVGVTYGYGDYAEHKNANATYIVNTVEEIYPIIIKN